MVRVEIERAENGAIVRSDDGVAVYEFDDGNLGGLRDMLWDVVDRIASYGSRYAKETIDIRIVHGDKYTCEDEACEICKAEVSV